MIIAVASGKGGTGKTTVAVSLALSLDNVQFADCDVEEPNAAIFLRPVIDEKIPVTMPVPQVDEAQCSGCGKCAELCAYNALVVLEKKVLVFPHMCHGCGGCMRICPEQAITERPREVGIIEKGVSASMSFMQGILNVGDPMATPIIKQLRGQIDQSKIVILDSPPGTSCPVIETVRESDFCILVTEPTPFGLHDLQLAIATVRELHVPFGVIINCAGIGDDAVETYCREEGVPLLMKIPWDRRIAEGYSRGEPVVVVTPELKKQFQDLYATITSAVGSTV
jgi:MinD superfamily P-loop ATPase